MTPAVRDAGEAILDMYTDMLRTIRPNDPAAVRVMCMAYREWTDGLCDSGSGVPLSDLETRLSRVIESLR